MLSRVVAVVGVVVAVIAPAVAGDDQPALRPIRVSESIRLIASFGDLAANVTPIQTQQGATNAGYASAVAINDASIGASMHGSYQFSYSIGPVLGASGESMRFRLTRREELTASPDTDTGSDVGGIEEFGQGFSARFFISGPVRYTLRREAQRFTSGGSFETRYVRPGTIHLGLAGLAGGSPSSIELMYDAPGTDTPDQIDMLESQTGYIIPSGGSTFAILTSRFGERAFDVVDPTGDPTIVVTDVEFDLIVHKRPGCSLADLTDESGGAQPDDQITLADFSRYMSLYEAEHPDADLTTPGVCDPFVIDGAITADDLACYLSFWSAGCP